VPGGRGRAGVSRHGLQSLAIYFDQHRRGGRVARRRAMNGEMQARAAPHDRGVDDKA